MSSITALRFRNIGDAEYTIHPGVKHCPNCFSHSIKIVRFYIKCYMCGCKVERDNMEDAIKSWNDF